MITQKELRDRVIYDNGDLYYRVNCGPILAGQKCGTIHNSGRCHIIMKGKRFSRHQLVYLYFYNYIPKFIDHINGNRLDDRIENLRPVTQKQNTWNRSKHSTYKGGKCSSKYKGVSWKKANKKWAAHIMKDGKKRHLGLFTNEKEAAMAYNQAAAKLYGEYARPNII